MPVRLLREGILTSDRVDALDAHAEIFYRRLMSKVDDYGRYDARPSVLRASLYPLRVDRVREADITRWIAACEKAGLIALYLHDGKPYLWMFDTGWQTRTPSKYPDPKTCEHLQTSANNCVQVKTNAHLDVVVVEDVVVGVVEDEKKARRASAPACPEDVDPQTWTDWLALRKAKRAPVTETVLREARAEAEKAAMTFGQFLAVWCRRGSQGLEASWLKPNERAGPALAKPSVSDSFASKTYTGTPENELPSFLRNDPAST